MKSVSLPETRQAAQDVAPSQPAADGGVVLEEGLRRHLKFKDMSSVRSHGDGYTAAVPGVRCH